MVAAMTGFSVGPTVWEVQRALAALEGQELLLQQVVSRMRWAATLADVPGGADWRGPAERAFSTVRDALRHRVAAGLTDVERALTETRAAITMAAEELAREGLA